MHLDADKLNELFDLAEKATPGEREWCLKYQGRPHIQGDFYESDAADLTVVGEGPIVHAVWDYGDAYISVEPEDRKFIVACDPETILALLREVRNWRASSPYKERCPPVHIFEPLEKP